MIRRILAPLLALALLAPPLPAQEPAGETIVAGLSQTRIAITTSFSGSDVLVFGAVRREAPIPDGPLQVIVTLEGPAEQVTVRRKERVAGIWINTDAVEIDRAPSFYSVASSVPLREALTDTEDLRYSISIPRAIRSVGAVIEGAPTFVEALIRIREEEAHYVDEPAGAEIAEDTLFRAQFRMPADLTEGTYLTRIFLTRDGRVVDSHETAIDVRKEGLERWLFALSREQPPLYGLLSLFIAVALGWAASAGFRYLRR
ncbi:TIGR02186 family protein [Frigidibacter oleivorans]|uniref:TIGR02186 family protein n=1 Tax=Frigidibacter oleivorans TaxID=2487129 RepID=UPI000F8DE6F9|nr:TIGR02186 family protein [Frigidibacter oleivorans]